MTITIPRQQALQSFPGRPRLVAGVGCRRGTSADEIIALIAQSLHAADIMAEALCAIGTFDGKAGEPGLIGAASHFSVPLRLFTSEDLSGSARQAPNRSTVVMAKVGLPAVAEAVAMRAGALLVGKRTSARATCAIGLCRHGFDLAEFGRAPGQIYNSNAEIASSILATSSAGP